MSQGDFYVATTGPISGPILLDGFALVVRPKAMRAKKGKQNEKL